MQIEKIAGPDESHGLSADPGSPAEEGQVKAALSALIKNEIERRGLTEERAAALLGCAEPVISNVLANRLSGISLDRLARFLTLLGHDVEIRVSLPSERAGVLSVLTG